MSTWAEWRAQFPETLALDVATRGPRFALDDQAVVVVVGGDSLAVTVRDLREAGVVNETVGGEAIVFALAAGTERPVVWSRLVDGETVEFGLEDDALVDLATGARFDVRRGTSSTAARLEAWPSFGSFPSDYARIWPDGRVWRPTGAIPAEQYADRSPGP